jgi:hypothetical protein
MDCIVTFVGKFVCLIDQPEDTLPRASRLEFCVFRGFLKHSPLSSITLDAVPNCRGDRERRTQHSAKNRAHIFVECVPLINQLAEFIDVRSSFLGEPLFCPEVRFFI